MVESASIKEIDLLDQIQERAVKLIRFGKYRNRLDGTVEEDYNIIPLRERRKKAHLVLTCRISGFESFLAEKRPKINMRSRNEIKFSITVT